MPADPIASASCVAAHTANPRPRAKNSPSRKVRCPNCGSRLVVPANFLGKRDSADCPSCGHPVDIRVAAPAVVHLGTEPVVSSTSAIANHETQSFANHETQSFAVASPIERRRFRTGTQIAIGGVALVVILGSLAAISRRNEVPEGSSPLTNNEHIENAEVTVMGVQIDDTNRAQQLLDDTNREIQQLQLEILAAEREVKARELEIEQLKRDTI